MLIRKPSARSFNERFAAHCNTEARHVKVLAIEPDMGKLAFLALKRKMRLSGDECMPEGSMKLIKADNATKQSEMSLHETENLSSFPLKWSLFAYWAKHRKVRLAFAADT